MSEQKSLEPIKRLATDEEVEKRPVMDAVVYYPPKQVQLGQSNFIQWTVDTISVIS